MVWTLCTEYEVAAAIQSLIAPASLMPSCSTWPVFDSL
jgi:hypothetical protein